MNITIDGNFGSSDNIINYISYIMNIILLFLTMYSEFAALSKCKGNGIIDSISKSMKKKTEVDKMSDEVGKLVELLSGHIHRSASRKVSSDISFV